MNTVVTAPALNHLAEKADDKTNRNHTEPNALSQKVQGALGAQGRSIHPGLGGVGGQVGFLGKGVTKLRYESM